MVITKQVRDHADDRDRVSDTIMTSEFASRTVAREEEADASEVGHGDPGSELEGQI